MRQTNSTLELDGNAPQELKPLHFAREIPVAHSSGTATAMGASSSSLADADMCCRADDDDDDVDRVLESRRHLYDGKFGASTSTVYSSASTCVAHEGEQPKQLLKRPLIITDEGYQPIWIA